jgi:hypothetical protein
VVARDARAPFTRTVRPRGKRRYLLRATVRLGDGRIVTLDRRRDGGCRA